MNAEALDGLLRELARYIAIEIVALQTGRDVYSQDSPPEGMTAEQYLRHCRNGDWEHSKEGRLRITRRAVFEAWRASKLAKVKPQRRTNSNARAADPVELDDDFLSKIARPAEGKELCRGNRRGR